MKRPSRQGLLFSAVVTVGSVLLALVIAAVVNLRSDERDSRAEVRVLASALGEQVKSLGATPVATPVPTPLVGPQGPAGLSIVGPPGPVGSPGMIGSPGLRGATGSVGVAGAAGPQGAAGLNGANGLDGPAGPAGPQGEPGPSGSPGADGAQGPQGAQGSPGPEPVSFSFDFANKTWTCSDPDGDGNYTCSSSR